MHRHTHCSHRQAAASAAYRDLAGWQKGGGGHWLVTSALLSQKVLHFFIILFPLLELAQSLIAKAFVQVKLIMWQKGEAALN